MLNIHKFCILILNLPLYSIICLTNSQPNLNACEIKTTCEECIMDPQVCKWCAWNDYNGTRCRPQSFNEDEWCPYLLQNPDSIARATSKNEFSSKRGQVVQIKPQTFKLKLRPGKPAQFNFSFKGAKDFPVDMYFLLDASKGMKKVKKGTEKQSEEIYGSLKNLTSDVYLGLGTFIDKRLYPFTDKFNSAKTYSFRHRLKLMDGFNEFKKVLSKTPYGYNRDIPEGGLDALAQVMSCNETIGWRNESRKIILYLSDAPYHAAGDGRSAGLFQRYDGQCYTENNTYTKELVMDYPSVGMINKLASDKNIIIFFLVEEEVFPIYQSLSSVVSGSKVAKYVAAKSSKTVSIKHILEDVYKNIAKKIKFKVNTRIGKKTNYNILFNPDCKGEGSGKECNVIVEQEQQFTGTITLKQYDELPQNWIEIMVEGFGEKLTLDVEFIKNCNCEKDHEKNSTFCHGEARHCGICKCGESRYGEKCVCQKNGDNPINDNSTCIASGSNKICSEHGSCICGKCKCRERYSGNYCECNMNGCKWDENIKAYCNGHGTCECGKCHCDKNWKGNTCKCDTSTFDCQNAEGYVCNNRGRCDCGICECESIAHWDIRSKQDSKCMILPCVGCHPLQCSILKQCVHCKLENTDCTSDSCPEAINTVLVENLSEHYQQNSTEWYVCNETRVKIGCYTRFMYRYTVKEYGIEILVDQNVNCAETFLLSGGVALAILLIVGVCTLVAWKKLTDARDRREYLNFMKHNQEGFEPLENPLYRPPSSNYSNPVFRKPSVIMR